MHRIISCSLRIPTKSDLSAVHNECDTPENFPTIAACKAASLNKDSRLKPEAEPEASLTNTCLEPKPIGEPALVRIKAEKDPEKLFHLFKSNAHNRLVVENSFAFEDTLHWDSNKSNIKGTITLRWLATACMDQIQIVAPQLIPNISHGGCCFT
ncbi:hypothetical protein OPV22_005289 [Ensete ventricosum]|uniref:Uncharacterized protein n=1 Tax=Ensete ventricosum TaxID=4639 RepID=A0AAV8RQS3_ENSVE|nr:hypothetical protein OPV22_005289 [Ensete ventricosum]